MILKPPRGAILNRTHPLARGLFACWLMNENTGSLVFDTANNYYGVCSGSYSWDTGYWNSTGSNSLITGPTATTGDNITICICLNYHGYPNRGQILVGKRTSWSSSGMTWQFSNGGNVLRFQNSISSVSYFMEVTPNNVDTTYTVTATNGNAAILYKNGKYHSNASDVTVFGTGESAPIIIGNVLDGSEGFNGAIKYAYIFKRILTPGEVSHLYSNPYAMFESESPAKRFFDFSGASQIPGFMLTLDHFGGGFLHG